MSQLNATVHFYPDTRLYYADATYKGSYFNVSAQSEDEALDLLKVKIQAWIKAKGPEYPKKVTLEI